MKPYKLDGSGTVVASTVVHVAAPGFEDQVPYALAMVELDDGCRVTAHVTDVDPHELKSGQRVRSVFRKLQQDGKSGVIYYGTKFVPSDE